MDIYLEPNTNPFIWQEFADKLKEDKYQNISNISSCI